MRLIRLTLGTGLVVAASFLALVAVDAKCETATPQNSAVREVTRAFLLDRIYGGWAGMLIGGLEGLPHEFNLSKTRPSLPAECKVAEQAETLMRVCERVILAHGGERIEVDGQPGYRVRLQPPRLTSGLESARLPVVIELDWGQTNCAFPSGITAGGPTPMAIPGWHSSRTTSTTTIEDRHDLGGAQVAA